ncbi:MAG: hypothetical protein ACKORA_05660, partial [Solirubrobacterales bacterium]
TEVERIVDGDPSGSAWSSETYSVESFGNKSGMGFWVETAGPQSVEQVDLRLSEAGASVTVYSAPEAGGPPDSLSGWTPVGQADGLGKKATVAVDSNGPSSYYLIWFTRLPASDGGDGYRVEVSDLELIG